MTVTLRSPAITDPELLAFAHDVGSSGAVAVAGSRTRWRLGGELEEGTRIVSAPTGIVDYKPEEMTVRVRAGTSVAELHAELANAGQLSPLPERGGTVGGAIAVGENCLAVLGRGRTRTCLLQVRYVSGEGRLISGGGNTVKNVSGFDIPRLIVGSLGTLGLIGEVLLRTNPIPEITVLVSATNVDPVAVADVVLRPNFILWDGSTTWVELGGNAKAVAAELVKLRSIGSFSEVADRPKLGPHRWSLKPSDLSQCGRTFDTGDFVASIGVGTVFASKPQPARTLSPGVAKIHARMKANFDPAGRLNPGRRPGGT